MRLLRPAGIQVLGFAKRAVQGPGHAGHLDQRSPPIAASTEAPQLRGHLRRTLGGGPIVPFGTRKRLLVVEFLLQTRRSAT